jgi:recombinational DNA repair protein RecT
MYKEDTTAANKQLYKTYKGREVKHITEMAKKIYLLFCSQFHYYHYISVEYYYSLKVSVWFPFCNT